MKTVLGAASRLSWDGRGVPLVMSCVLAQISRVDGLWTRGT